MNNIPPYLYLFQHLLISYNRCITYIFEYINTRISFTIDNLS